jgi:hypothetical protein
VVAALALLLRGILPPASLPWFPGTLAVSAVVVLACAAAIACRREPASAPLSRDPGFYVLVVALALLVGTLLSHRFRITSDGLDHYVYLRSLWMDRDLDLDNDYRAVQPGWEPAEPPTPRGRTANVHPVGPALAWAPFYAVAEALSVLGGWPRDGLNPLYKNAVSVASLLYGWLGLVLVYRTAADRFGRAPALLASLGLGFGTFLFWYLAYAPTMAHAPAFAAAALVVWIWLRPGAPGIRRAALLGAACGLAALMRPPNVLLALLPAVEALPRLRRRGEAPRLLAEAAVFVAGAALVFAPQMVVWWCLYGSLLTLPQGAAFIGNAPALGGVLFSPRHGLFSWSPLLYLGAIGLLAWARREPLRAVAAGVFLLALTWLNAGVADWWGGAAFGARRFDAALPLMGLGLALALTAVAEASHRRPMLVASALLLGFVLWNQLLARQYLSGAWDYSEPVAFEDMGRGAVSLVDRAVGSPFSLPASLLEWLRSGRPPSDYESLYIERRYSRWSVRMGLDDRIFLEDGWSDPKQVIGTPCRILVGESAGLVVPLHRPRPYRLGARLALPAGAATPMDVRVLVVVNQRPVGSWEVAPGEWQEVSLEIPAEALRAGRNLLRIRRAAGASELAVGGLWLDPLPAASLDPAQSAQ